MRKPVFNIISICRYSSNTSFISQFLNIYLWINILYNLKYKFAFPLSCLERLKNLILFQPLTTRCLISSPFSQMLLQVPTPRTVIIILYIYHLATESSISIKTNHKIHTTVFYFIAHVPHSQQSFLNKIFFPLTSSIHFFLKNNSK